MQSFNKRLIFLMILVLTLFQTTASTATFAKPDENSTKKEEPQTVIKTQTNEEEISLTGNNQDQGSNQVVLLAAPSGFHLTEYTSSTVQLGWTTPTDYVATSYEIYMNDSIHATIEGDKDSFIANSLDAEATYHFKIRAQGLDGTYSSFSEVLTVTTKLDKSFDTSQAIFKIKPETTSNSTATISWSHPDKSSDIKLKVYEIYVNDIIIDTVPTTNTSYTLTNLSPATTYSLKVRAVYEDDSSDNSNTIQMTTASEVKVIEFTNSGNETHSGKKIEIIENPTSSAGSYIKYNGVEVGDWYEIPFDVEQGNYLIDLQVLKGPDMGIVQVLIDDHPVESTIDLYSNNEELTKISLGQFTLDERVNHTIRINVIDKNAESSAYALVLDALYLTHSQKTSLPAVPMNFNSAIQSDTAINLEWDKAQENGQVESYEIYVDEKLLVSVSGDKNFYLVKDLTPGTDYTFKIRALNKEGLASEFSDAIVISTLSGKQIIEFESLSEETVNSGKIMNLVEDHKASAGQRLDYEALEVGDFIEFPLVTEKGIYETTLRIKGTGNSAIVAVSVDGASVNDKLDLFQTDSNCIDISLGALNLSKKKHVLRFEVIGKNQNSTGYGVSVDALYLTTPTVKDTFEPNDTIEQAALLESGKLYESYISSATDVDYYKFVAPKEDTYFFTLHSPEDSLFKQEFLKPDASPISVKQLIDGLDADTGIYLAANTTIIIKISSEKNEFSVNPYQIRITESSSKQYTYDDANRLTRIEYEQGLYHYEMQFEYDNNGNLLKKKTIKTAQSNNE
ncbi:chitodextrinase [Paenibacillus turicensis]|uniref:Chitodextrinase n=1 Tax=Paenibacillus turicensis TaxID=160487 RepID=A0ABS4FLJ4_9BACL|nr:fibronectin type III domain-containing protein [Paenibacillus turicensis]MBP1903459.1 chitodextrinase [Paenibacillus turicensis]